MNKKVTKSEEQWEELESFFKELKRLNPSEKSFVVLTSVVMEGRYNTRTITRAVNKLVDESDYCTDTRCRAECFRPHGKKTLKYVLHHYAYPSRMKMVWLSHDEIMRERVND